MPHDHHAGTALSVGHEDRDLAERLSKGLDAYDFAATGTSLADQGALSVRAVGGAGGLVGGLTARTWGGLRGVGMLWVREDSRRGGWGGRLQAAGKEARRRGCDRACVSSFTFRAPDFYRRHGYAETVRTPGIPGGAEDVHLFKRLVQGVGPAREPGGHARGPGRLEGLAPRLFEPVVLAMDGEVVGHHAGPPGSPAPADVVLVRGAVLRLGRRQFGVPDGQRGLSDGDPRHGHRLEDIATPLSVHEAPSRPGIVRPEAPLRG
ncbi:GNAT family N-acetyltransferase [Streptomyces fradiae]|uniref:GNAT family N-acetyltransferase n=1 Tax=Streptomyces fradiae TaxID=1906 RepID=UPI00369396BC